MILVEGKRTVYNTILVFHPVPSVGPKQLCALAHLIHTICFISNHSKIGTVDLSKILPVQSLRGLLGFFKESTKI